MKINQLNDMIKLQQFVTAEIFDSRGRLVGEFFKNENSAALINDINNFCDIMPTGKYSMKLKTAKTNNKFVELDFEHKNLGDHENETQHINAMDRPVIVESGHDIKAIEEQVYQRLKKEQEQKEKELIYSNRLKELDEEKKTLATLAGRVEFVFNLLAPKVLEKFAPALAPVLNGFVQHNQNQPSNDITTMAEEIKYTEEETEAANHAMFILLEIFTPGELLKVAQGLKENPSYVGMVKSAIIK